jgi:WD40 repeat protein
LEDPSVFLKSLNGHTDAVWNMALVDNTLATVSADSTVRIWNPFSIDELDETAATCLTCFNEDKSEGAVPTSVDFVNNESSRIVASFGASHHTLFDVETSKIISKFDFYDSRSSNYSKFRICYLSHSFDKLLKKIQKTRTATKF